MPHPSLFGIAGLLLVSCSPAPQSPARAADPPPQIDRERAEEQQRQQQQAEARLRVQEARTSAWQLTSAVAFGLVSLALLAGIILGSHARHASRQK